MYVINLKTIVHYCIYLNLGGLLNILLYHYKDKYMYIIEDGIHIPKYKDDFSQVHKNPNYPLMLIRESLRLYLYSSNGTLCQVVCDGVSN